MPDLQDKVAVITGAAGLTGRATAAALQQEGCMLVLLDIDDRGLDTLATTMGASAFPVACDVSDAKAVADEAERVRRELGGPDIVVNNAGILSNDKLLQTDLKEWRKVLAVNVDGAFLPAQQFVPAMKIDCIRATRTS